VKTRSVASFHCDNVHLYNIIAETTSANKIYNCFAAKPKTIARALFVVCQLVYEQLLLEMSAVCRNSRLSGIRGTLAVYTGRPAVGLGGELSDRDGNE